MEGRPIGTPKRMTGGRIWRFTLAVCALVAALAFPATAVAKPGLVTGFTGLGRPLISTNPAERAVWFDRTAATGAGTVRLSIDWRLVAGAQRPADPTNPASPSYDFTHLDGAVRDAEARGLKVLLAFNDAPTWAEGPGRPASAFPGSWKPNPSDVAAFSQALADRYSGGFDPDGAGPQPPLPAAQALQVWNEPNQDVWLAPQFEGKSIIGPDYYREMLNASYAAVKTVNPKMIVVTGGTSPYGDPPGGPYPAGGARVRPVQWWQRLLCVKPAGWKGEGKKREVTRYVRAPNCSGKPMFDVLAHQAIDNTGGGPLRHGPHWYDASTPDLGRVVRVLRAAERLGTVSGGPHPVWVTEFWWDSDPPNPAGSPLLTQARWIEQSLYLFWKGGASAAINFQIRDGTLYSDVRSGFQSGLYFLDGAPKPSLTAFRFPFVTERIDHRTLRAWGKAPEAGKLRIQRKQGARWKTIKDLKVSQGAVFVTKLRSQGRERLRATAGSSESVIWKQPAAGSDRGSRRAHHR
jgi:hypothetical protein